MFYLFLFDAVMALFAVSPGLAVAEPLATMLHFGIAAVNATVIAYFARSYFAAAYLTFSMCVIAESIQVFSAGRTASVADLITGAAGICAGLLIASSASLHRKPALAPVRRASANSQGQI